MAKPNTSVQTLEYGATQVIIRQTNSDEIREETLVVRNYDDGSVSIEGDDGDDVYISRDAWREVCKWIKWCATNPVYTGKK